MRDDSEAVAVSQRELLKESKDERGKGPFVKARILIFWQSQEPSCSSSWKSSTAVRVKWQSAQHAVIYLLRQEIVFCSWTPWVSWYTTMELRSHCVQMSSSLLLARTTTKQYHTCVPITSTWTESVLFHTNSLEDKHFRALKSCACILPVTVWLFFGIWNTVTSFQVIPKIVNW